MEIVLVLNKVIKVSKGQPYNVHGMPRSYRIVFFEKTSEFIIKCDVSKAKLENIEHRNRGMILSPSKAVKVFPKLFIDDDGAETIFLNLPSEMLEFCKQQGEEDLQEFIKKLIEQAMQ